MSIASIWPRKLFGRLTSLFAGLPVLLVLASSPAPAADYFYDHNGSRMRVSVSGAEVKVFYQVPRAGLKANGVRAGTLLFDGRVTNGYLEGMSRIFHANCGVVDYFVYGDFKAGRDFRLNGAAPVLSGMSCRIVDNVHDGPNANLVFTAVSGSGSGSSAGQKGCLRNVTTSLNVRVGPGSHYGRIHEIPAGTCGIRVRPQCRGDWCVVEVGNAIGWVSMKFVQ